MNCVTDTHALIWYLFALPELSQKAKDFFDEVANLGGNIFVPTICIFEIIYLSEKNRLPNNVLPRVNSTIQTTNSVVVPINLSYAISQNLFSIPRSTVSDMPDRIISATALHLGLPLVTRDRSISQLSIIKTIW
ncbi:MAG: type II toxin-antitoxin system VapC family toxin [Pyrinomonadaceae bacterium]